MAMSDRPELPTGLSLGEFLKHCIERGVRPPPRSGEPWAPSEFAKAVNDPDGRKVRFWLNNQYAPRAVMLIAKALFGSDEKGRPPEWGVEIVRAASDETRARKRGTGGGEEEDRAPANAEARDLGPDFAEVKKDESEVAPSASSVSIRGKVGTPAQLAVGGTLIAVGFIHLVWLATRLANVAFGVLVGDPWIYGDVVFGIGGIVIGFGTTKALDWGRTGGTWLCILGLISGVLWFGDPEEPELVAKAINIISLPLAAVGLLYFLLWWPAGSDP